MTKDPQSAPAAATDQLIDNVAKKRAGPSGANAGADRIPAPPLVHIRNPWLEELTVRIRSRPIPWEGYQRADLVSAEELKLIKKVDAKGNAAGRPGNGEPAKIADNDASEYALLYLRLLAKLSRTDTLQQILVLIGDMLVERDDRAHYFVHASQQASAAGVDNIHGSQQTVTSALPWGPFLKLLDAQDEFVQLKSAQFLVLLLISDKTDSAPSAALPRLTTFLSTLINAHPLSSSSSSSTLAPPNMSAAGYAEGNGADIAIQLFESLLRSPKHRRQIWEEELRVQGQEAPDKLTDKDSTLELKRDSLIYGLLNLLRTSSSAGNSVASAAGSKPGSGTATPSRAGRNGTVGEVLVAGSTTAAAATASGTRTPVSGQVGPQLQYQSIFCLWLLSFDDEVAEKLNIIFPVVATLTEVAKSAIKEKVIRVIVATFRNLLQKASAANAPALLGSKVLPLAESLTARKWSDEEINEDLDYIVEELNTKLQNMSTYEVYLSELASGQLTWESPVHELDEFWRANTSKLLENDAEQLKRLITILKESEDPVTLSVVCSDLGKIISFSETAKKFVNESSAKVRIMELISHQDSDVKFRALNTVSKLISASWR
ncbi:ARM repeat-containing protein [Tilletiaria anomala UBC 951]|uniref:ARM repeat-containing protein n=1 Tax=Tilletiaria anomala (strain ATCC 24038 / CBS 436.72 / UBC 951) TaxID=1037660 RepID=A0A066WPN4_TILAU|nr:ARM repeat-containing protein [Tilletiaria anomala UBC 951]KDN52585.1 ARM repeat-containing protein [Tilletiaria anomala UBC 951]